MNLTLISDRVIAQVAALGSRVSGAAELQVAIDNPERVTKPHAYVVWVADAPLNQSPVPGQQARFREDFLVVVAVDNTVDARGDAAVSSVETLGASLKTALVGWAPSSSHLPVVYEGSAFQDMDKSMLIHSFSFSATVPGGSIFTYNLSFSVLLLAGVTIADVYSLYAGKLDTVIGASTRLASDYLIDREAIPESATRYQLREPPAGVDQTSTSTSELTALEIQISVHHHLAPGDSERTYTETTMVGHLAQLLPPSYWRDGSLIREVTDGPSLGLGADLARE